LENQHGCVEVEVMGLNVTEFRHAILADCCFAVEEIAVPEALKPLATRSGQRQQ